MRALHAAPQTPCPPRRHRARRSSPPPPRKRAPGNTSRKADTSSAGAVREDHERASLPRRHNPPSGNNVWGATTLRHHHARADPSLAAPHPLAFQSLDLAGVEADASPETAGGLSCGSNSNARATTKRRGASSSRSLIARASRTLATQPSRRFITRASQTLATFPPHEATLAPIQRLNARAPHEATLARLTKQRSHRDFPRCGGHSNDVDASRSLMPELNSSGLRHCSAAPPSCADARPTRILWRAAREVSVELPQVPLLRRRAATTPATSRHDSRDEPPRLPR